MSRPRHSIEIGAETVRGVFRAGPKLNALEVLLPLAEVFEPKKPAYRRNCHCRENEVNVARGITRCFLDLSGGHRWEGYFPNIGCHNGLVWMAG